MRVRILNGNGAVIRDGVQQIVRSIECHEAAFGRVVPPRIADPQMPDPPVRSVADRDEFTTRPVEGYARGIVRIADPKPTPRLRCYVIGHDAVTAVRTRAGGDVQFTLGVGNERTETGGWSPRIIDNERRLRGAPRKDVDVASIVAIDDVESSGVVGGQCARIRVS